MSTSVTLGEWIKDELTKKGEYQYQLADAIGVDDSTVSSWVLGDKRPSRQSCAKIATYFGVSREFVEDLAGHRPPRRPSPAPVERPYEEPVRAADDDTVRVYAALHNEIDATPWAPRAKDLLRELVEFLTEQHEAEQRSKQRDGE